MTLFIQGTSFFWLYSPYWPSSWPFYTKCTSDRKLGSLVIVFLCSVYDCTRLFVLLFIENRFFHWSLWSPLQRLCQLALYDSSIGYRLGSSMTMSYRILFSFGAAYINVVPSYAEHTLIIQSQSSRRRARLAGHHATQLAVRQSLRSGYGRQRW